MSDLVLSGEPAGRLLAAELDERGWTQADFAMVIDRPTQFVSEIITGKKEITRESAAQIGAALGQTPEFWLNIQNRYLLGQQSQDARTQSSLDQVRRRARLNELAPIATLRSRGLLKGSTLDELEAEVLDLFELKSIDEEPTFAVAARRSNGKEPISAVQATWAACVRRLARAQTGLKPHSADAVEQLGSSLGSLLKDAESFKDLPKRFADAGVNLIHIEAFPGAKIDGCAFAIGKHPVVGVSGRGKRLDKVLFTLLHELAHVSLGHAAKDTIVEALDDGGANDAEEAAADKKAADWLLPDGFPTVPDRINLAWINQTAAELDLAPIVLIGQLQKRGRLEWRSTLAKGAPQVSAALAAW